LPVPLIGKYTRLTHHIVSSFPLDDHHPHVGSFDETLSQYEVFGYNAPKSFYQQVSIKVIFEGPSITHFILNTPVGKARMIKCQLPTEPLHVHVHVNWWAEKSVPYVVARILSLIAAGALEQDRQVWENKIYAPKPTLVKNDGAFTLFNKWYCTQFYSESSNNQTRDSSWNDW
jgi:hypothetical protein